MSGRTSSRSGNAFKTPAIFLASTSTHSGRPTWLAISIALVIRSCFFAFSRMATASPALELGRRDVNNLAVNFDALVAHKLARFGTCRSKAHAINRVVETTLQQAQQVFTRGTFQLGSTLVVIAELTLEHTVHTTELLLFTKLQAVIRHTRTTLRRATRRYLELALRLERT